jgi:hypothetical protein
MGSSEQGVFYKKIEGIPLKVEIKQPQFGMTMEVVSVERKSLPAADFALPKDFKETQR